MFIATPRTRARSTSQNDSIEVPRSVEHAYEIDRVNGHDFWRKTINKEAYAVGVSFGILDKNERLLQFGLK